MDINANQIDFASVCIFAIRYAQGRRTYAPSIVVPVILGNLEKFSDKDLSVLISDYEHQKQMESYGDPKIDRPLWESYASKLYAERERRRQA